MLNEEAKYNRKQTVANKLTFLVKKKKDTFLL